MATNLKILLLIAFAFLVEESSVFGQVKFNKRYGIAERSDTPYTVFATDSGYVTAGVCMIGDSLLFLGSRFTFHDLDGSILSEKRLSLPISNIYRPWNNSVKKIDSGYIWCSSYTDTTYLQGYEGDFVFIRYNNYGDTVWTKVYSFNDFDTGFSVEHTPDGGFVGAGYSYTSFSPISSCGRLVKIDSLGNLVWSHLYNCDYGSAVVSVTVLQDGSIVAGGQIQETNQFNFKNSLVFKTDSVGNLKWSKQLGGPFDEASVYVTKTSDGNILATGSYCYEQEEISPLGSCTKQKLYMAKLDSSDGHIIWDKKYCDYNLGALLSSQELNDGNIIATGYYWKRIDPNVLSSWMTMGCLLKTSASGDSLWFRTYYFVDSTLTIPIPKYNELYSVKQTVDGGYVACGQINGQGFEQDSWIIKTDEYGCLISGCNVVDIDELEEDDYRLFIYPNPAQNYVSIDLPITHNKASLQIYNMQGQLVKSIAINGGGLQRIETTELPNGIYQLLVSSNSKLIGRQKLVVTH